MGAVNRPYGASWQFSRPNKVLCGKPHPELEGITCRLGHTHYGDHKGGDRNRIVWPKRRLGMALVAPDKRSAVGRQNAETTRLRREGRREMGE